MFYLRDDANPTDEQKVRLMWVLLSAGLKRPVPRITLDTMPEDLKALFVEHE